jgi:hypothetical protein
LDLHHQDIIDHVSLIGYDPPDEGMEETAGMSVLDEDMETNSATTGGTTVMVKGSVVFSAVVFRYCKRTEYPHCTHPHCTLAKRGGGCLLRT